MKRTLLLGLSAALLSTLVAAPARAQSGGGGHNFGLGVMLGAPTELNAKLYLGRPVALQMGIGYFDNFADESGLHLHVDVLWHPAILARESAFTMPFYLGVGGRLLDHNWDYRYAGYWYRDGDTHLGVRVPFGLLMDFNRVPLDIFLEIAVVVDLVYIEGDYGPYYYHHNRAGLNGGIGLRYYF